MKFLNELLGFAVLTGPLWRILIVIGNSGRDHLLNGPNTDPGVTDNDALHGGDGDDLSAHQRRPELRRLVLKNRSAYPLAA